MASAAAELQKAIVSALRGDPALTALLGGEKLFDHAPASVAFPYLTFGRASLYDWSTATEDGSEHLLTLHAWSKGKGRKEALAIMQRLTELLHDRPLALAGFSLVNLRLESSEVRHDDDQDVHHAAMRFRGVVEGG